LLRAILASLRLFDVERGIFHVCDRFYKNIAMFLQGPAQAQNLRDTLAEINSDIKVRVSTRAGFPYWSLSFTSLPVLYV
jgi:hypothetical protein